MSASAPVQGTTFASAAIDAGALDREGAAWWDEVVAEVPAVVGAPDTRSAAALIVWWHAEWLAIGDTPARAAGRLRRAARAQRGVDGDRRRRTAAPEAAA